MSPKFLFFSVLAVAFALSGEGVAQPLSQDQAHANAVAFLRRVRPGATLSTAPVHRAVLPGTLSPDSALFHVFALAGDGGGFVIASGDSCAVPVLGYVSEGPFCADSLPANLSAWLQGYAAELAWARAGGAASVSSYSSSSTSSERVDVDYLVPTLWGQGSPYNADCVFSRTTCYTGCVATAMAQVLYYWGVLQGYTHGSTSLPSYTTSSMRYSVAALPALDAFDWSNLEATYTSATSTASQSAVAQLMRYCAQSVGMDFSSSGSGASSTDIVPALRDCFSYDSAVHYVSRSSFTAAAWDSVMYAEVSAGRPVLMSGIDGDELVGHAFVCDGYQASTGLYHFNWGWTGSYNGYFALEALQPGGTGTGGTASNLGDYSVYRDAVVGIQSPSGQSRATQPYDLLTAESVYLMGDTLLTRSSRHQDASGATLMGVVMNTTGSTLTLNYDYALFTPGDTLVRRFGVGGQATVLPGYGAYFTATLDLGSRLPYGTYYLRPVGQLLGDTAWLPLPGSDKHYVEVLVDETCVTLRPAFQVEASVLSQPSGSAYSNQLCLLNTGQEELSTTFVALVDGSATQYLESYAAPGACDTLTLSHTGLVDASSTFILSDVYQAVLPFVADTTYADVEWDMQWEGYIDASNRLYGDTYSARLILSNRGSHAYVHDATVTLFPYGGRPSQGTTLTLPVSLSPHSSGAYAFSFDDLTDDVTYDLQLTYYTATSTSTLLLSDYGCALTPTRGIVVATPAGLTYAPDSEGATVPSDAYYVDLRHTDAIATLTAGSSSSTLYILPSGSLHIASLTGKNTVFGTTASSVTLDLAHGFQTPVSFTAGTLTATFAPQREGWQPLALPFAPDTLPGGLTLALPSALCGDTLSFALSTALPAFCPGFAYVPAELVGDTLVFTATSATVPSDTLARLPIGDVDLFVAPACDTIPFALALSASADAFVSDAQPLPVAPLDAYALRYSAPATPLVLDLPQPDATAVAAPVLSTRDAAAGAGVYNLQGMRLGDTLPPAGSLRPGLYLHQGKKYLIR